MKRRGRPRGGIILTSKKGLVIHLGETRRNEETIVELYKTEDEEWTIGVIYMRGKREDNWQIIREVIV